MNFRFYKNILSRIFRLIMAHKVWSFVVAVIIIFVGYFGYSKIFAQSSVTRYILGNVQKGNLVMSVSGSGQISAYRQLSLAPKVSGDIVSVNVKNGDEVKAGTIIAQIYNRDAIKAVRDAEANLVSAQISLQKTKLESSQNISQANTDLGKAYDDGFTYVANAFVEFPNMVSAMDTILYNVNKSPYMDNGKIQQIVGSAGVDYKYKVISQFESARTLYNSNFANYKKADRNSEGAVIEKLVSDTKATAKALGDAVKNTNSVINYISTGMTSKTSEMTTDQSTLNTYISKSDSILSNLISVESSIVTAKNSVDSLNQSFNENILGEKPIDVQSAELAVIQKQNALIDAQNTLSDYYVRAPFDGIVSDINIKNADSVSSATTIATIFTKQQIATVTLNEVDAVNVRVSQKATLTFDALQDLKVTGSVTAIDSVGTVSQGVVNYNVEIGLDEQNEKVKPGMSVSATITTSEKEGVILVPSSAIKNVGKKSVVQVLDGKYSRAEAQAGIVPNVPPRNVEVEIGDSNDTNTEIISGLNENDQIVVRTVTGLSNTSSKTGATNRSIFGGSRLR